MIFISKLEYENTQQKEGRKTGWMRKEKKRKKKQQQNGAKKHFGKNKNINKIINLICFVVVWFDKSNNGIEKLGKNGFIKQQS